MQTITDLSSSLAGLFGLVVALAVLVTGFFLGRKWLGSAMSERSGWDTPEGRAELAANEEAKKTGTDWL